MGRDSGRVLGGVREQQEGLVGGYWDGSGQWESGRRGKDSGRGKDSILPHQDCTTRDSQVVLKSGRGELC